MLDRLALLWFLEIKGYPLWGWIISLVILGLIVTYIVGGFFLDWDFPNRCNPDGDCWPE